MHQSKSSDTTEARHQADGDDATSAGKVQRNEVDAFTAECIAIGSESAATKGFRLEEGLPDSYRDAFNAYRGKRKAISYHERKLLNLRISAVGRGMVVDPSVSVDLLRRIIGVECPICRERFEFGRGRSPERPSLDRLVNEVSYRAGNICAIAQWVNKVKKELSFEEVLQVAQAREHHAGLAPAEWLRLASLMYGAWARAYKQSDLYLLPLAAIPGPGMFMSTSQAVQLFLTRHFSKGGNAMAADDLWLGLTRQSDCGDEVFLEFRDLLAAAVAKEKYPEDAWQHEAVFGTFARWYLDCRDVVDAQVEAVLHRHHERLADPIAELEWPYGSRYKH